MLKPVKPEDQRIKDPRRGNKEVCGGKRKNCNKCRYRFTKADAELWACPKCGADRHCWELGIPPSFRCRNHGGKSPGGIACASFVHGRKSRHFFQSDTLRQRYEWFLELGASGLTEHLDTIALLATRVADLMDKGLPEEWFDDLGNAWGELEEAMGEGGANPTPEQRYKIEQSFRVVRRMIKGGASEGKRWKEIVHLEREIGRARERQDKHDMLKALVPMAELFLLVNQVQAIILKHVTDSATLRAIQRDIEQQRVLDSTHPSLKAV